MSSEGNRDFWRVVFAYILPPLGVYLQVGLKPAFWINLLLVFLGGFPGVLHALWVVAHHTDSGRPAPDGMQTFISLVLCGLLPPLGVAMKRGLGMPFLINVLLTIAFWIPGMLHAIWIITEDGD